MDDVDNDDEGTANNDEDEDTIVDAGEAGSGWWCTTVDELQAASGQPEHWQQVHSGSAKSTLMAGKSEEGLGTATAHTMSWA